VRELGAGQEGDNTGGALEFHGGGRICGRSIGAEEGAGANQVVREIFVLADVAFHGLRFVGKTESARILAGDGEGISVGKGETERWESWGGEKVAEKGEAAAAEENVGGAGVRYEVGGEGGGEHRRWAGFGRGDVNRDERDMAVDGEGFGKEISKVVRTWDELDCELMLTDPTLDPVETHVYWLTLFGSDCV
jgi:hypothetical protein